MKALILAGGFGTRLAGVLPNIPKPMAPIGNIPFLEVIISRLEKYGFSDVYLLLHHKAEVIIEYCTHIKSNVKIHFITENKPLGTGGSILNAVKHFNISDDFFVLNGDSLLDVNYLDVVTKHKKHSVTMCVVNVQDGYRYGMVEIADGVITQMVEKDGLHKPAIINAGVYLMNGEDFSLATKDIIGDNFSMENDFFQRKNLNMPIIAYNCGESYFIDIGIPKDYDKVKDGQYLLT